MTRKDYKLLANAVLKARDNPLVAGRETSGINLVVREIADALASDNPRFDRSMFIEACGL